MEVLVGPLNDVLAQQQRWPKSAVDWSCSLADLFARKRQRSQSSFDETAVGSLNAPPRELSWPLSFCPDYAPSFEQRCLQRIFCRPQRGLLSQVWAERIQDHDRLVSSDLVCCMVPAANHLRGAAVSREP